MIKQSPQPVDWHQVHEEKDRTFTAADFRARLRACVVVFLLLLVLVFGRVVQLEVSQGAASRRVAGEPIVEQERLPAARGRILTRDGTVLAHDKQTISVAVRYRYLEDPPNPRWLRSMARGRLSRKSRRDAGEVAAAERRVRQQCQYLRWQLAELCEVPLAEWNRRAVDVQTRVERIAQSVNQRRQEAFQQRRCRAASRWSLLDGWFGPDDEKPPERTIVREEYDYHVMAEDVPLSVVAEIEGNPVRYPGVRILNHPRRDYPAGSLAAHVLGYLGRVTEEELKADQDGTYEAGDWRGRTGLEQQFERALGGCCGERVEKTDHSGRVLSTEWVRRPRAGADLVLTLDGRVQKTAESLLDDALARRELIGAKPRRAGAAVVVMDVHSGAILALASAPRFDPGVFAGKTPAEAKKILNDPGKPLFHRAIQMAIAPGSVFKVVSAIALVRSGAVDPKEFFYCRGYLERPGALRCQVYRQFQQGHGEVQLVDALAVSCNVYFFHHAGRAGCDPLIAWARRLEFGRRTGIDLPGEATGRVPTPESIRSLEGHDWRIGDTRRLAVGQGSLTVTPLQVARLMAAVANGGRLVTPHVASRIEPGPQNHGQSSEASAAAAGQIVVAEPRPIVGLNHSTLETIRRGLRMAVESPLGTAYSTVFTSSVEVAAKTGTAQTGGGRSDHAWFAGYVPARKPRFAVVVVLEHSGAGGEMAGPVARRLILRMHQLGLLF